MGIFPCNSAGKESACNAGDLSSIPGLGRSPGGGKGYLLQCSGLKNSMDCISMGSQRVGHDRGAFSFTCEVGASGRNQTTEDSEDAQDRKTSPLVLRGSGCLTPGPPLQIRLQGGLNQAPSHQKAATAHEDTSSPETRGVSFNTQAANAGLWPSRVPPPCVSPKAQGPMSLGAWAPG